jgi:hypothetical protein
MFGDGRLRVPSTSSLVGQVLPIRRRDPRASIKIFRDFRKSLSSRSPISYASQDCQSTDRAGARVRGRSAPSEGPPIRPHVSRGGKLEAPSLHRGDPRGCPSWPQSAARPRAQLDAPAIDIRRWVCAWATWLAPIVLCTFRCPELPQSGAQWRPFLSRQESQLCI